ncbi:Peptidoglycan/xylan/chitin deacetylase, PgdA/CDA1 family [Paenibacillus catalpae]|uniref:Peptidoglycan/xylan/chitin deacetylase, PgdA/CDA1 family n=1 Tax=Paenibacillus catalpae TaxID=1045775 RepID=A0A1I1Z898_9BACL|nr:polysaccharide deacetylase family protein [Paenibacillus catalpae]SFE26560.1 Peptidoglycan/xylan/chitin deacetylase, PgdA/CDA1 family [Paenibacillus catalpae]
MLQLLLWAFYFLSFYAFIPALISRVFGFRVFKKGRVTSEIALTFDDGPDPEYTPLLLDLLARYKAKATFFVVGSHAEKHPELLRRMQDEGHIIGIHNYVHKTNWFMRPKTVRTQIELTQGVIREATGIRSAFYRPPWGIVNIFDFMNRNKMQIILWSAIFGDWNVKLGTEHLKQKMMRKMRPGEVLLLHDCGRTPGADPTAPANMLIALEAYMEVATKRGFRFVGIAEMMTLTEKTPKRSVWKRTMVGGWLLYEKLFHLVFRLKHVGGENSCFHYRVIKYHGEPIKLADNGYLKNGDKIVEMHFDNKMLSSIALQSSSPLATGIKLLREMDHALPELARAVAKDPEAEGVRAAYGVTMIHRGADRIGFQVEPLPDGLFARTTRIYLKILTSVLTNKQQNARGKAKRDSIRPHMLLMPLEQLLMFAVNGAKNASSTKAAKTHQEVAAAKSDTSLAEPSELDSNPSII